MFLRKTKRDGSTHKNERRVDFMIAVTVVVYMWVNESFVKMEFHEVDRCLSLEHGKGFDPLSLSAQVRYEREELAYAVGYLTMEHFDMVYILAFMVLLVSVKFLMALKALPSIGPMLRILYELLLTLLTFLLAIVFLFCLFAAAAAPLLS